MDNQEMRQALELFDSSAKWQAFVDLAGQRDNLKNLMYQTAAKKANAFMVTTDLLKNPQWDFLQKNPGTLELQFFLKEYGPESIRLTFGWEGEFWLRTSNKHRFDEASALVSRPEFKILELSFGRIDARQNQQYREYLLVEKFNFSFGSPSDEHFGPFRLAWFAYNETESFLQQIAAKVAKFQTPEATEALAKLNETLKL